MVMITPAEFEDEMKRIAEIQDLELKHKSADELMCSALDDNGYSSGVKIFKEMSKWYS